MKKLQILAISCWLLALSFSAFSQTIRRVNNNIGVTGVNIYATIQAAHDAATNGDIIYVEPSGISTGNLTCTKQLTIIGNGYYLSENYQSGISPISLMESVISDITFATGGSNSKISGISLNLMTFGTGTVPATYTGNVTGILVERCKISNVTFTYYNTGSVVYRGTNITVRQCVNGGFDGGSPVLINMPTSISVQNSIIYGNLSYLNSSIINNCVLNNANFAATSNQNSTFTNNVFRSNGGFTSINGATNIFNNNLCYGCSLSPGSANQNVVGTGVFVNNNINTYLDKDLQLAVSSPAIGAGIGGINCGIFGGTNPYVLSGLPPYPVITNFNTTNAGNASTPLQVSVTVRGNN